METPYHPTENPEQECVLNEESSDKIMTGTKGYGMFPNQCDQYDIERAMKLVTHNHREHALGDIKLWVGIKINNHPAFKMAQCCQTRGPEFELRD